MFCIFKTISKNVLVILFTLIILSPFVFAEKLTQSEGIITAEKLNVRIRPDRRQPTITRLNKGTRVTILENIGSWVKIKHQNTIGYVRNRERYINIEPAIINEVSNGPDTLTGYVVSEWLNVRPIPDTNQKAIFILKQGTRVYILENYGKWLKISFNNKTGYIRNRKKYIQLTPEKPEPDTSLTSQIIPAAKPLNQYKDETVEKVSPLDKNPAKNQTDIYTEIKKHEDEIFDFSEKEKSILENINQIELSLNATRRKATKIKNNLSAIEEEIEETENKLKAIRATIKSDEKYISKRLVSIYKLKNIGNMQFLASANTLYDFFKRKKAIDRILLSDAEIFNSHLKNLENLMHLKNENIYKKEKLIELKKELDAKINLISTEKTKRSSLLNNIQNKKELTLAAISSLKKSAEEIEKKIMSTDSLYSSSQTTPNCHFSRHGMILPVKGKIISKFGQGIKNIFNFKTFQNGIDIKSERGEPILAVCNGKIIFSNWLQGYGNLIIIDHGDNYHTVYAHAEELFKNKGEIVEYGEVIATVGESGSRTGPLLYFEIRHRGKPVDPLFWLKQG